MEKEVWKDKILRSLEGAKRAEPDPQLYGRIQTQLRAGQMQIVRSPYLALAAACLAVLLTANIYALAQQNTGQPTAERSVYQVDQTSFDLY